MLKSPLDVANLLQCESTKYTTKFCHYTLLNIYRFSKFFQLHTVQEIINKVKDTTKPQTCHCTTL